MLRGRSRVRQKSTRTSGFPVRGMREFYDAAATEAGIALDLEVHEELKFPLDRTLFQRAVGNLVQNALAHTPPSGHVLISAEGGENGLTVRVSDDGIGIASEHLSKV